MGNSPSKNEPLPRSSIKSSSNNNNNLSSNGTISDLEAEDKPPALSHLGDYSNLKNNKKIDNIEEKTINLNSKSSAIDINNKDNKVHKPVIIRQDSDSGSSTNNSSNSRSNNTKKPSSKVKGSNSRSNTNGQYLSPTNYDLEIGLSMAQILKEQQNSPSSLSSSDFSISASPVFTTVGNDSSKDSDSLSSTNSSFKKHSEYLDIANNGNNNNNNDQQHPNLSLINKLDSIAETQSIESSPEPKKLSQENLKKHNNVKKIYTSPLSITKEITKFKSESSSSISSVSPPLLPTTKNIDIDIDTIIERLLSTKKRSNSRKSKDILPIDLNEIKYILGKSRQIFMDQPSLLRLSPPVKVVGDIHGQFYDLLRIFNCCGYPPHSNYLFLGDYVDRGEKSLETILLLLCYKIKYPENFFMLRGNHESANITKIYGFYDECKRRLKNTKIWKTFIDVFNSLPTAAIINDKIFCVHGGLSPELTDFKQIENIKRPTDVPDKGLLADLLWSDPDSSVKNFSLTNWPKNDRGVSYCFGKKHVDYFCSKFKLDLIVRGHMVVEDGYEFFNKRKLVTVFSAPNYCGEFNNYGAIMSVDKKLFCSFELIKPT